MSNHRYLKAAQLFVTVTLSRFDESVRFLTRVPREAAGEAATQLGDASLNAGRRIVDATGTSLRTVGRGVAEVGRATDFNDRG